jgi:threonine dehydrogenase-like Zn-dependent dehydrogenase
MSVRGQILRAGAGRAELVDHEWPHPGPGQMLVRVTRSQISAGSEMNGYRAAAEPRPTGYTTAGRVEQVGPDVDRFRPGDRVLAFGNQVDDPVRAAVGCVPDRRGGSGAEPACPSTHARRHQACFRLISNGQLVVDDLVSHVSPPARAGEMYELLARGAGDWMSVIVIWN